MNILLDNRAVSFTKEDFPMLIHGAEKTGASFFSICLLANLLKAGNKILFISAFPMAKEEFRKQIAGSENNAIIIDSGEETDLIEALKNTLDINERVVLIKNIENYSVNVLKVAKDLKRVVFSGDIDKCAFVDGLLNKQFSSKILFSPSVARPQYDLTGLPKYHGKVINNIHSGIVSLGAEE